MKLPTTIDTIIAQLGGPRIFAMAFTASTYDVKADPTITFKIAPSLTRGRNMTHVRVTLTPADTYTVEILKVRGRTVKTVGLLHDVYTDMLKPAVEANTGLYLSL